MINAINSMPLVSSSMSYGHTSTPNEGIGNHINHVSNSPLGGVINDITSTVGGVAGGIFGGPIGATAGTAIGSLVGRLINVFV